MMMMIDPWLFLGLSHNFSQVLTSGSNQLQAHELIGAFYHTIFFLIYMR